MNPGRIANAATTFACAALLGVSLSVDNAAAQTREDHMATKHMAPKHMSSRHMSSRQMSAESRGPMRRHVARGYARGYGPNPVQAGADVAAGAVNTAGAVAAGAIGTAGAIAAAPFGAGPYAAAPGWDSGYYGTSTWGDFECSPGYAGCRPYAEKNWYTR